MFAWIADNLGTIIVSIILAAVVALIIIYMVRRRKKGGSCHDGGSCSNCTGACPCCSSGKNIKAEK